MHLADAFIQSKLQCIQAIYIFVSMYVPWELNPQFFCAANAMLYHWATGTNYCCHQGQYHKKTNTSLKKKNKLIE